MSITPEVTRSPRPANPYPRPYPSGRAHPDGRLRASHADREPVVEQIKEAYAQGRLDKAEFDLRLDAAMSARTHEELAVLLRDLPGAAASRAQHRPHVPHAPQVAPASQERLWGAAGHLAGIVSSFVGPLVLYVLADRRHPYAREQLAEAVNFQLTLLLVTIVTFGLGGIAYAVAWAVSLVAAAQALGGDRFRYPLTLRLLR